jgi:hypothetical protein
MASNLVDGMKYVMGQYSERTGFKIPEKVKAELAEDIFDLLEEEGVIMR